jgi:hypothetical protein
MYPKNIDPYIKAITMVCKARAYSKIGSLRFDASDRDVKIRNWYQKQWPFLVSIAVPLFTLINKIKHFLCGVH